MNDYNFTEDEIREQLQKLGYSNIPDCRLREFKDDLDKLIHKESQHSSPAQYDSYDPLSSPFIERVEELPKSGPGGVRNIVDDDVRIKVMGVDPSIRKQNACTMYPRAVSAPTSPTKSTTSDADRKLIKRKVLRKINGESFVDQSFLESESDASVSDVPERFRRLPVNESVDDSMSSTVSDRRPWTADPEISRARCSEDASLKSLIIPMSDHPHYRNIKKVDNVTRYHQYKQLWDAQKAPGEKAHKSLRWGVKENMLYHDEVVKKTNKVYVPNGYVVPTEKKRKALRWQIRNDIAKGHMPSSGYYSD